MGLSTMVPWSKDLLASSERAALAIGRLDSSLEGHPLRQAWEHRMRLAAAVQASAWNGRAVDPQRLAGVVAGVPYHPLADLQAEHRALIFLDFLARLSGESGYFDESDGEDEDPLFEDQQLFIDAVEASSAPTILLALAEVSWSIRRERDAHPGILHAAIPSILAQHHLTRAGLIPGLAAFPAQREKELWKIDFLKALAKAAEDGLERLKSLSLTYEDWRQRVGPRQKNSRLPQLVAITLCHPFITPIGVQRFFGTKNIGGSRKPALSLPGASKLIAELVDLGILSEGTDRRGSHRLFLASDLGVGKITRNSRRHHPKELGRQISGQQLDELLDGIDAALRRSTALLARHGMIGQSE